MEDCLIKMKPIPEWATRLSLLVHWCGDDICDCTMLEIEAYSVGGNSQLQSLYKSGWYDWQSFEELLLEAKRILEFYKVEADLTSENPHHWEITWILN